MTDPVPTDGKMVVLMLPPRMELQQHTLSQ
jgi:hypothetical protein